MLGGMKKSRLLVGAVIMAAFFLLASYDSVAQTKTTLLRARGGGLGGISYMMTAGLAKIVQDTYTELIIGTVPGSGLSLHILVGKGEVDIGNGSSVYSTAALAGKIPARPMDKASSTPPKRRIILTTLFPSGFTLNSG